MTPSPVRIIALLAVALPAVSGWADEGHEFFEKKVRPILLERCLECHSHEKKVKGGLVLDSRAGWEQGGDAGPAIVPGKPDESLLIKAARYTNPDLQMPEKRKLPDAEIAVLEEWVRRGAPDPRVGSTVAKRQTGLSIEAGKAFWSYIPPKRSTVPSVKNAQWPRNTIDRFILAGMEKANLPPGPDAAPEVLARRLSYNLVGLPPSADEVTLIREHGVERAIDRWLASPQFGEHWGRHWLDVARFAESSGGGRTLLYKDAWRYRDYVIDAMNTGVPYDQFLREQLAGDLMPHRGIEEERRHRAATAFLALGPTNYEEQDKQQLRFDVIDEQLDTIGKVVMGQTIGCARCHDHKFDPIPQRDYYALAGIFASTRTLYNYTDNVARWVAMPIAMEEAEEAKYRASEAKIAEMKATVEAARKQLARQRKTAKAGAGPIEPRSLAGVIVDDDDAKAVGEWNLSKKISHYIGNGYRTDHPDQKSAKTLTFMPKLLQAGRYEVRLAYVPGPGRERAVPVHVLHADGEAEVTVNQALEPPIDGRFVTLGTYRFEKDGAGYVLVSTEGTKGFVTADAVQFLPEEEASGDSVTKKVDSTPQLKELEAKLKALVDSSPQRPTTMTVREVAGDIEDTEIRVRGLVNQKGEKVPRGFLAVCGPEGNQPVLSNRESGRKELAEWLTSKEHPLTARVFVNRVWHWMFGHGLVRSVDNFGTTGDAPSHPELLDYLAVEFVERGWSLKWLVKEIAMSRTWQLAAGRVPADPDNRWLSRAHRRRLTAEQLRDTMLMASGELDPKVLGPNIAGAGEINANDTSAQNIEYRYEFNDTRRSVYTPAFRARRLELFEVFDFGNINAPLGARPVSNVAPQALFMLNHPWVRARAEKAAEKILASEGDETSRLTSAMQATIGRMPSQPERSKFLGYIQPQIDAKAGWADIFHTLFACIDFRYLD